MPRSRDPRTLLLVVLVVSWLVMLVLMRSEFWALPSAEVLRRERMVRPPTLEDLGWRAVRSAVEVGALTALLWPGRGYLPRLIMTSVGLAMYWVVSAPMSVTSVTQVHRRWLAGVSVGLLLAALLALLGTAVRALRR